MSDKKERRAKVDACWDILTARPARAGQRRKAG
jgi:hypothetical protein